MLKKKKTDKKIKVKQKKHKILKKNKKNILNNIKTKYQQTINEINDNIWIPNYNENATYTNIKTNSWFSLKTQQSGLDAKANIVPIIKKKEIPITMKKCIKVTIIPTKEQKNVLNRWFSAYMVMYNETLKHIKSEFAKTKKLELNFRKLRNEKLVDIKKKIVKNSRLSNNKVLKLRKIALENELFMNELEKNGILNTKMQKGKSRKKELQNNAQQKKLLKEKISMIKQTQKDNNKTAIMVHILDTAIKLACANYKSAVTNKKNGNIKHFRIRYWKMDRCKKIMELEQSFFKHGTFCSTALGQIKAIYNNKPFDLNRITNEFKSDCKLQYDSSSDSYYLFVPKDIETKTNENQKEIISLDPGIRTFMTGISEDEILKIGENDQEKIKKLLKKSDEINGRKEIKRRIRKKISLRISERITNMVDDLHWKSINYLVSRYKTILIGDMSVQGIVSNMTSNLTNMTKRVASRLKFYEYRQRLIYKCELNGINYKVVDEKYTSKVCSVCGDCNDKLGGNKRYDCKSCGVVMDRDVNGARGIMIKSTY